MRGGRRTRKRRGGSVLGERKKCSKGGSFSLSFSLLLLLVLPFSFICEVILFGKENEIV